MPRIYANLEERCYPIQGQRWNIVKSGWFKHLCGIELEMVPLQSNQHSLQALDLVLNLVEYNVIVIAKLDTKSGSALF